MSSATTSRAPRGADERRRFERAMGRLWETGIVALGPIGVEPARGHEIMRDQVARRFPGGMGSYLFWTRKARQAFRADGSLAGEMTLHCSGGEVAEAAVAVLQEHGIDAAASPEPRTIRLFAGPVVRKRP